MSKYRLTSAFVRHAPNRPVLQSAFCGTGPNLYKKLMPCFSSGSKTVTSLLSSSGSSDGAARYIEPVYELMARQQYLLEMQQATQIEYKKKEEGKDIAQGEIISQQSALIKDMFSSFETSFKTMMDTMTSMMSANNMALQNLATQGMENSKSPPPAVKTPDVFTKAVPIARARNERAANDPIHVGLNPHTGKITRQDSGDAA